jgi:acetyl/propionyl-CoA carboxylase alpha subunit
VDTAIEAGDRVPPEYDPLIAKLIAHAGDRQGAIARLRRALGEFEVGGIQTTLPFHRAMLDEPAFAEATGLATTWVDRNWDGPAARARAVRAAVLAVGFAALTEEPRPTGGALATEAPVSQDGGRQARSGAWRAGGRVLATDRWPT